MYIYLTQRLASSRFLATAKILSSYLTIERCNFWLVFIIYSGFCESQLDPVELMTESWEAGFGRFCLVWKFFGDFFVRAEVNDVMTTTAAVAAKE